MGNSKKKIRPELVAPAGNLEKMKTAFAFGADAVYLGVPDFSLRVRINDFTLAKIKQAVKYAHERKKRVYVTINIFAHNKHLEKLPKYVKELKKLKVDGVIISDPGVLAIVKKIWPSANIHLSTQANCTNWQSAKFWYTQGVKRIVLGRETTLAEIKEIHKKVPGVELEYFVHGAMCMAYSGRCFLSKYFTQRSANLGDCAQSCRWEYSIKSEEHKDRELILAEDEHGSYILNSKDLCLIEYLDDLAKAGVMAFKIEGRAKSVYYQAVVSGIYSHITHNMGHITKKELSLLKKELEEKLVNRGYTTGFLLGDKADQNLKESHKKCDWEFCGQVYNANATNSMQMPQIANYANKKGALVKVHNSLRVGDRLEIVRPKYDIIKISLKKMWDSKTGEEIKEAHGGQEKVVVLEIDEEVPEFSVLRRKVDSGKISPAPKLYSLMRDPAKGGDKS